MGEEHQIDIEFSSNNGFSRSLAFGFWQQKDKKKDYYLVYMEKPGEWALYRYLYMPKKMDFYQNKLNNCDKIASGDFRTVDEAVRNIFQDMADDSEYPKNLRELLVAGKYWNWSKLIHE